VTRPPTKKFKAATEEEKSPTVKKYSSDWSELAVSAAKKKAIR